MSKIQNEISIGSKVVVTAEYLSTYNRTGTVIRTYTNRRYKIFFKNERKNDSFLHYQSELRLLGNGSGFQDTFFCKWCNRKNKYYVFNCKYYSLFIYYCPKCLR